MVLLKKSAASSERMSCFFWRRVPFLLKESAASPAKITFFWEIIMLLPKESAPFSLCWEKEAASFSKRELISNQFRVPLKDVFLMTGCLTYTRTSFKQSTTLSKLSSSYLSSKCKENKRFNWENWMKNFFRFMQVNLICCKKLIWEVVFISGFILECHTKKGGVFIFERLDLQRNF